MALASGTELKVFPLVRQLECQTWYGWYIPLKVSTGNSRSCHNTLHTHNLFPYPKQIQSTIKYRDTSGLRIHNPLPSRTVARLSSHRTTSSGLFSFWPLIFFSWAPSGQFQPEGWSVHLALHSQSMTYWLKHLAEQLETWAQCPLSSPKICHSPL